MLVRGRRGDGDDFVRINESTFNGGSGNDHVDFNNGGTVNGGAGLDTVDVGSPPIDGP